MKIKDLLKKINDSLQPYYLFLTMLFFFITSIGTLGRFFSGNKSDISVSVKYDRMEYPSSINNKYLSVYNSIILSKDSTLSHKNADEVRKFLTQTQSVKHITIRNNRNRVIQNVAFRDCSVSALTAYGSASSFKLSEEGTNLLDKLSYDAKSNIVFLDNPITLYPHEELFITLWGSFNPLLEGNSIFVNYDDHTARVVISKEFSGFAAIIAEYYDLFFIFLCLIFFVVFYNSIVRRNAGKENNCKRG